MKLIIKYARALIVAAVAVYAVPGVVFAGDLTPKEVLDKIDDLFRGESSTGRMTMKIVTTNWQRTMSLEFKSKGKERSLVRILAPKKEKDTATLRVEREIWNYLPKVNRVIKLPSSMMSSSWMGSHFTNDDLVKESRMAEDYNYEISREGMIDGREIMEVTCIPKPDAAVVWGKIVVRVNSDDFMPLFMKYFDEDMLLARTMFFSQVGDLGGRNLPSLVTVVPEDKPGEKTEVKYSDMEFNLDLPDSTFSLRNLRR